MRQELVKIMQTPLPPIEYQKKRLYVPDVEEIRYLHKILNEVVFGNKLRDPPLKLKNMMYFGLCSGYAETNKLPHHAAIALQRRYHCVQWVVLILAHEMAHQYQWEVDGAVRLVEGKRPLLSHGPTFYKFSKQLKEYGIPLRKSYCSHLWLATQNNF